MFKAVNQITGEPIIILDAKWSGGLTDLRTLDHNELLVCPGCQQPVQVRAGAIRRWHFAHKHAGDCVYGQESQRLLDTRAVLYQWLQQKWGNYVTLEYRAEGVNLSRPVDCWVSSATRNLGYWIVDGAIQAQKRDALQESMAELDAHIHWVFVADMLNVDTITTNLIHLTTTERAFRQQSMYDAQVEHGQYGESGSLHYLDPQQQMLITYRGLYLVHPPGGYKGHREQHPLMEMLSSETGAFVHPGEHDQLLARRAKEHAAEQERRIAAQRDVERIEAAERQRMVQRSSNKELDTLYSPPPVKQNISTAASMPQPRTLAPKCVRCGERTDDWWYRDGATNTCECRRCYRQRHTPEPKGC